MKFIAKKYKHGYDLWIVLPKCKKLIGSKLKSRTEVEECANAYRNSKIEYIGDDKK